MKRILLLLVFCSLAVVGFGQAPIRLYAVGNQFVLTDSAGGNQIMFPYSNIGVRVDNGLITVTTRDPARYIQVTASKFLSQSGSPYSTISVGAAMNNFISSVPSQVVGGGSTGGGGGSATPIADNLTTTIPGSALDARQGKILQDTKAPVSHTHSFSTISGIATPSQLGTGTPGAGKYLDGSGVWTTLPTSGTSSGGGGSGGGGVSTTKQTITSGSSVTLTSAPAHIAVYVDPVSTLATLTLIMPDTPVDNQVVSVSFGGTLAFGRVVNSLILAGNSGQTILQATSPSYVEAGESIAYRYNSTNAKWYRLY